MLSQAGSDHRHAQLVAHIFVIHGAEDDVGVFSGELAHRVHHFVDFLHPQAARRRDVDQHALGTGQIDAFEQWGRDGLFGSDAGTVNTGGVSRSHHGHAHFAHNRAHVFEVDVDEAGEVDDFGDAANGVTQDVIRCLEGLVHRDVLTEHVHQAVVEDDDQGIDVLLQFQDTCLGDLGALAFKTERLGHHGHCQDTHFTRHFGDDRRCAGARSAAHAGGDEGHVRALQRLGDLLAFADGRVASYLRLGARTQPGFAEAQLFVCDATLQGLRVGVGGDEFDAHDAFADHVIDRIAAGTADADHLDHGLRIVHGVFFLDDFKHGHTLSPSQKT